MTQFKNIQAESQIHSLMSEETNHGAVKRMIRDTDYDQYKLLNNHNVYCFACSQDKQAITFGMRPIHFLRPLIARRTI